MHLLWVNPQLSLWRRLYLHLVFLTRAGVLPTRDCRISLALARSVVTGLLSFVHRITTKGGNNILAITAWLIPWADAQA